MDALVSIIIPTYNRACFLGGTLDSILAQTYENWECIVVDDDSVDYTGELMAFYYERDPRIRFHRRPKNRLHGGNACRNIGFEKSRGRYIQWFDSDDLMVPEFLEVKVKALEENAVDFVISKAANFKDPNPDDIISRNEQYYRFEEFPITHYNYVTQRINWLSPDFMGKREVVEKVRFNEKLKSSQERNYFSLLTYHSIKVKVLDEYMTLRRVHNGSIRKKLEVNIEREETERRQFYMETWRQLSNLKAAPEIQKYLLVHFYNTHTRKKTPLVILKFLSSELLRQSRYEAFFYFLGIEYLFKISGRGYFFRKKFLNAI